MIQRPLRRVLNAAALLAAVPLQAQGADPAWEQRLRQQIVVKGAPPAPLTIAARMANYAVPGVSVAVIEDCKVVDARGFGVVEAGGAPVRPDTLFQAASISKPVAALAALRLVEREKLSLDADVRTDLKSWTVPDSPLLKDRPVTLRGLLTHSAGLTVHGFGGYAVGAPLPTTVEILDGAGPANSAPVRVKTAPGERAIYSGGGFTVAQLLMTDATGRPFPALMRELVLDPAGMTDSTFDQPLVPQPGRSVASGHSFGGKALPGRWHVYPEMAAAGLWTTPRDLAKVAIAVMRAKQGAAGAILAPALAADMLRQQIGTRGLGWEVTGEGRAVAFGHGGSNEGFRAQLIAYPATCQGAVVMTNSDGGRLLNWEVLRALADAYRWPDPLASVEQERVALTPAIAARFAGRYLLRDVTLEIAADGAGGLSFSRNGAPGEPLFASPDGLFAPQSGVLIGAPGGAAGPVPVLTLVYAASGNRFEAARVVP